MININDKAPVKCTETILINASLDRVWSVLTNVNQWKDWQTDISHSVLNGELKPNTTFEWETGGAKINSILHTVKPFDHFGWTGRTLGLHIIHNWTMTNMDGKTKVNVTESMEGFLSGLFKKTFNKTLKRDIQFWLERLEKTCSN